MFDLVDDPDEMVNLWDNAEYREVRMALVERLAELEIDVINSRAQVYTSFIEY